MGAFGGAKAQNFLKVLAPVGARKEAFEQTGGARKNRTFFHGFWLVGAAAGEKKNPDAQKSTSVSYPLPANRPVACREGADASSHVYGVRCL